MPNRFVDAVQRLLETEKVPPEIAERLRGKLAALIASELKEWGDEMQSRLATANDRLESIRREVDDVCYGNDS